MNASQLQAKISRWALDHGYEYNKLISMSKGGWPDCLIVINGITYYFEIKIGKDRLSPLQKMRIKTLNKDREIAYLIKNWQDFIDIAERLMYIW